LFVGKPDATLELAPQNFQLMPKHRFSASSFIFDLIDAAKTARAKHKSRIIPSA
jgi:hypothetical protein